MLETVLSHLKQEFDKTGLIFFEKPDSSKNRVRLSEDWGRTIQKPPKEKAWARGLGLSTYCSSKLNAQPRTHDRNINVCLFTLLRAAAMGPLQLGSLDHNFPQNLLY